VAPAMLKVLVAGLVGTLLGVAVMIIVILATGTTTSNSSTIGEELPNVTSPGGSSVTPTTTPGAGGATGGATGGSTGGQTGGAGAGDAAKGKQLFTSSGCGNCHPLAPAGTSGKVGPDLDNISADVQAAGKPLDDFIVESIEDPNAYVAKGFSPSMPPRGGADLSDQDVADLAAFISQSQGS
jgi:cytochrome c551/c552